MGMKMYLRNKNFNARKKSFFCVCGVKYVQLSLNECSRLRSPLALFCDDC
jgi:hypothetical protein